MVELKPCCVSPVLTGAPPAAEGAGRRGCLEHLHPPIYRMYWKNNPRDNDDGVYRQSRQKDGGSTNGVLRIWLWVLKVRG